MSDQAAGRAASPARKSLYRQLRPGPGRRRDEVQANQRSRLIAATIELIAERGYDGTTVRDITRLAGVSKASFYEQFSGKPACFTASCDTVLRAAASAVLTGESSASGEQDRLRAGLAGLADLIAERPKGARLVLVDGLAAPPEIRDHVRRRFGLLEALVHERLAAAPDARELPKPLIKGIVRGIAHHVTRCVRLDQPHRFRDLVDPLLDWGLSFNAEQALRTFAAPPTPLRPLSDSAGAAADHRDEAGIRQLLMAATLRLASSDGYAALSPSRIRRAAGVSRRSFDTHFDDATDCFLDSVEAELAILMSAALDGGEIDARWAVRTCLVLDRLAALLASKPDLARLAFVESLDAAPRSILWRERLVADWAEGLYCGAPSRSRPSPVVAEATIAAIWGFLADLIASDRLSLLPAQGPRLAFFALAPALGADAAAKAIAAAREAAATSIEL